MLYRTHRKTPPDISTKTYAIPGYGYEVRTENWLLYESNTRVYKNAYTFKKYMSTVLLRGLISKCGAETRVIHESIGETSILALVIFL